MSGPFFKDIGVIAAKIEATEGTAETPIGSDAFLAEDITGFMGEVEMTEQNPVRADFSPDAQVPGKRSAVISFRTLLKGSGAAGTAPEYGELFRACGYAETIVVSTSVTYNPVSSGHVSATIVFYHNKDGSDGKKTVFIGCRGNWSVGFENGIPMYIDWEFTAADYTPGDSAPLVGSGYDTPPPLTFQGSTFTVHGSTLGVASLSIDAGNNVVMREDISKSSGHLSAVITGMTPTGSFDPEETLVATFDLDAKLRAGTLDALSMAVGGSAGNIVTITAPKTQFIEVSDSEREGLRTNDVNLAFIRDTGNDHLAVAFT